MEVEKIKTEIERIVRGVEGVRSVFLITDDGLSVVSTLETGEEEIKSTAVGAILCSAGERGSTELELGDFNAVVTIAERGYFVISRVKKEFILMVVAGSEVPLGIVLLNIRRAIRRIRDYL
jgi:hypothetical protein